MLTLSVASVAFAAGSITINAASTTTDGAADTTEYTWYQILEADIQTAADVNETTGATTTAGQAVYYVTTQARADAIEGTNLFKVTKDVTQDKWYVELKDKDTPATDIAAAFNNITNKDTLFAKGTFAQTAVAGTAKAENLNDGYYLITSTLGDELVVQTLGDVKINTKNTYPPVNKTVDPDDKSAQIGTDVTFTLTVDVPQTAADQIVLTDTMTEGLTFKAVDKVNNGTSDLTADTDYTVSAVNATNNSFTITFPKATIVANKGNTLTITYTATLNEKAAVGVASDDQDGNDNTVVLDYGNNYTSKPVTVEVDTQEFKFDKVDDADTSKKLPGAVFELRLNGTALKLVEEAAGEIYRIATATETNTVTEMTTTGKEITVKGLDADVTYQLVETAPPTGYNLPENPSTDVQANTSNTLEITIKNNKGATLPSTGGIGTTIFYIAGAVFVLGAAAIVIARRKAEQQ